MRLPGALTRWAAALGGFQAVRHADIFPPGLPPTTFRCGACKRKVGRYDGKVITTRNGHLPLECRDHGVLADITVSDWARRARRNRSVRLYPLS